MENIVTNDLREFGRRELALAGELLIALHTVNDKTQRLDDGVQVFMNKNSGYVFLSDENYNVAMMNGHILEDWHNCPDCGQEGFLEDITAYGKECCHNYLKDIL